jgi:putative two-component system response regulator
VRTAYEICRWHHERYDGRGYPDGLRGEEIPISAQIVALADVYDALTSPRVYKPAFSHEEAMGMILRGESGTFNPLLLTCLKENADNIKRELAYNVPGENGPLRTRRLIDEVLQHEELSAPQRTLRLLEREQSKYHFFADMSHEILFEYTCTPSMLTLSEWGAEHLGVEETVMEPLKDMRILRLISKEDLAALSEALHTATQERPIVQTECQLVINGEPRWHRIICRITWGEEPPQYIGAIGKAVDIHEEHLRMSQLHHKASHDSLTGLWNHDYAREYIVRQLQNAPEHKYAILLVDLDNFKEANDQHGHIFGDGVLRHTAEKLRGSVRSGDIVARIGGDEFLIFLEYSSDIRGTAERIFRALSGPYAEFEIRVSMGVALSEQNGSDYDTLLHCADRALYAAKRSGRGDYCFYNASMQDVFSSLFPAVSERPEEHPDSGGKDQ